MACPVSGTGGLIGASGCGKPKKRLGIFSSIATFRCAAPAAFWRARNNGAKTSKGSSKAVESCAETVGVTAGLIHERMTRQAKVTLPCFKASSTLSTGKFTLASCKFSWTISWRKDSGHDFDSVASTTAIVGTSRTGSGVKGSKAKGIGAGESKPETGVGAGSGRGILIGAEAARSCSAGVAGTGADSVDTGSGVSDGGASGVSGGKVGTSVRRVMIGGRGVIRIASVAPFLRTIEGDVDGATAGFTARGGIADGTGLAGSCGRIKPWP